MCRLLAIRDDEPFEVESYLDRFAEMCRDSPEYQGHGWGLAMCSGGGWRVHKDLTPIWEASRSGFGEAELLLVHARSAFRNEGIELANNMPFQNKGFYFIFNGELHGVRVKVPGRIGAEKIFNYIQRFEEQGTETAFRKATNIIRKRSRYIRAMNTIMTDGKRFYLDTHYQENPDYFTLYQKPGKTMFCSQPLGPDWQTLPNNTTLVV